MSEPTRVWAISSGSYSDYSVKALFATKKQAQAFLRSHPRDPQGWASDWNDPEEFYLYPEGVEPKMVTTYEMQQDLWDDGTEGELRESERAEWEFDRWHNVGPRPQVRQVRAPIYRNKGGRLEVRGTDQQAVRQVFSDRVAMWRATHHLTVIDPGREAS